MKKLLPITMLSMFAMLTSGCGCSLNQKKINENSEAIKETDILKNKDGKNADFTAELSYSDNMSESSNISFTVSRDVDTNIYVFTENQETTKIYAENGKIVSVKGESKTTLDQYAEPYYAFMDTKYYAVVVDYETYKDVPYNACHSFKDDAETNANRVNLPGISKQALYSVTCKAEKPVFGKKVTYDISYRLDLSTYRYITLEVNKDNYITSINIRDEMAAGKDENGNQMTRKYTTVLKYNYDDIKASK